MENKLKRANRLSWFILISVFIGGVLLFGEYRKSDTPAFVLAKLDDLAGDKKLMDSIGGQTYFEFSFNKGDFKFRDTVNYSITIKGSTRILNYKGSHVKTKPDTWILYEEAMVISN